MGRIPSIGKNEQRSFVYFVDKGPEFLLAICKKS